MPVLHHVESIAVFLCSLPTTHMFASISETFRSLTSTQPTVLSHSEPLNTRENLKVEVLTIKDYKKAARTLQIAFQDDLYVNYLTAGINDSKIKQQMDLALFEATTYSTILSGLLVGVRDLDAELTDPNAPFLAVACFHKPEKNNDDDEANASTENKSLFSYLWSMYQGGYLKFVWLANKETRQRVFYEQWELLDKYRQEVLGEEFHKSWYLSDIGAIPRGRGKGLARMLVDYVCQKYIDRYSDDEDVDISIKSSSDEDSKLDDEIQSFNFKFNLDNDDNLTDYSGYSSFSDNESTHSSWYYKEEDDILSKYDRQQRNKSSVGAPLYLESSHPRNRKIYQKLGFTYIKTVGVADVRNGDSIKTLTMDLMVRGIKGARWSSRALDH